MAAFHAAQALIFERENRVIKTHSGVHGEFARLVRDNSHFDDELRAFLGRAYDLKVLADYQSGPGAKVTFASSAIAIPIAQRFVAAVAAILS